MVPLRVSSTSVGDFKLIFNEFETLTQEIFLKDKYFREHNVKVNPEYLFTYTTSDTASQGANRFQLVIGSGSILPVDFVKLNAVAHTGVVSIDWEVPAEENIMAYEVHRSENSFKFHALANIPSKGNSSTSVLYGWTDKSPLNGPTYYRIKAISLTGVSKYKQYCKGYDRQENCLIFFIIQTLLLTF